MHGVNGTWEYQIKVARDVTANIPCFVFKVILENCVAWYVL